MNEEFAYVRNGRSVPWSEINEFDLRLAINTYPDTDYAKFAAIETSRRFKFMRREE